MKKWLIVLLFNSIFIFNGICQQSDSVKTQTDQTLRKNAIYLEIIGNAPRMSLNYERNLFHKNNISIFGRMGFGFDIVNLNTGNLFVPSIPIEISYSIGKRKHYFEVGIGSTPFISKMEMWSSVYFAGLDIDSIDYKLYILITPRIGYRYESNNGWLIRVAYTPILYNSSSVYNKYQTNFGISFGKLF
jgi:hypothetical protein